MRVVLAGVGAFGVKHLEALRNIPGVEVACLVGRRQEQTRAVADRYGVPHAITDLEEALSLPDVQAAILATPTQLHAHQLEQQLGRPPAEAGAALLLLTCPILTLGPRGPGL